MTETLAKEKLAKKDYVACLLNPFDYTTKAPSIMPIPTSLAQNKHLITANANSNGEILIMLDPYSDSSGNLQIVSTTSYNNYSNVALSSLASYITSSAVPPTYNTSSVRRIVAAGLSCLIEGAALNMAGNVTYGQIFNLYAPSNTTTIAQLRSEPNVYSTPAVPGLVTKSLWTPCDPTSYQFTPADAPAGTTVPRVIPFVYYSGLPSGTPIAIQLRTVIEFVPSTTYVNLTMPTLSSFFMDPSTALNLASRAYGALNKYGGTWSTALKSVMAFV